MSTRRHFLKRVDGDGPEFHWDYYNSFVVQPMLVEALAAVGSEAPEWSALRDKALARLTRWAAIQVTQSRCEHAVSNWVQLGSRGASINVENMYCSIAGYKLRFAGRDNVSKGGCAGGTEYS